MKHTLIFPILLLFPFWGFAQWLPLNGPTTTNGVFFLDAGHYMLSGTQDGVFRSDDQGLHWEAVPDLPRHYNCFAIATNQDNSQVVAVLHDDACKCLHYYKSNDQGAHWSKISTPGFAEYSSAVFSGEDGYLLTSTSRIQDNLVIHANWESFDGGNNWRRNYMDTLSEAPVRSLQLYGNSIWGYAGNKLLRGGQQLDWQVVSISPDSMEIDGYFIRGDTLLLNSFGNGYSRVWRSLNKGATWDELPFQASIFNFQQSGDILLSLNAFGNLISSKDDGLTWAIQTVDSIALGSFLVKGSNVIAYAYGSGVVLSQDQGKHFTPTLERLGAGSIPEQMTILENKLYVTNPYPNILKETLPWYDIVHKSWGLSTPPSDKYEFSLLNSDIQAFHGRLFACLDGISVFRSENKGLSWEACTDLSLWPEVPNGSSLLPMGQSLFLYNPYFSSHYFLSRTDDDGKSWINLDYPDAGSCAENSAYGICLGKSKSTLFAASRYGQCLYKSEDLGDSWEGISVPEVPVETDSGLVYIVCMEATDKMILLTMGRLERNQRDYFNFVSLDSGASWIESDAPIGKWVWAGTAVPKMIEFQGISLLTSYDNGVYISQDSGRHWLPFNQGLTSVVVLDIETDSSNIYVSTWGHGVWQRPRSEAIVYQPENSGAKLHVSVGPNPSSGLLRIVSGDPIQLAHIQWFDVTGRLCLEQDITFDCDQAIMALPFQNGVYFYRITDENGGKASGKVEFFLRN